MGASSESQLLPTPLFQLSSCTVGVCLRPDTFRFNPPDLQVSRVNPSGQTVECFFRETTFFTKPAFPNASLLPCALHA